MLPGLGDRVEVVIEVPRGSPIKRRPDGSIHFVSPLPSPFNYGSVVGSALGADGDPLDALVLGERLARGRHVSAQVLGVVDFLDDGAEDPKLVVGTPPLSSRDRLRIERFFRLYACFKRALRGGRGRTAYRGWRKPPAAWSYGAS